MILKCILTEFYRPKELKKETNTKNSNDAEINKHGKIYNEQQ
jgi:hypothetical protein